MSSSSLSAVDSGAGEAPGEVCVASGVVGAVSDRDEAVRDGCVCARARGGSSNT